MINCNICIRYINDIKNNLNAEWIESFKKDYNNHIKEHKDKRDPLTNYFLKGKIPVIDKTIL